MDIEHSDQSSPQPLTDPGPPQPDPSMSEENLSPSQPPTPTPSLETKTKAAILIQANIKRFLACKALSSQMKDAAKVEKKLDKDLESQTRVRVKEMCMEGKLNLRRMPINIWLNLFKFCEGFSEILELRKVCKVFDRILTMNAPWINFVENNYPSFQEVVLRENPDKDVDEIEWKQALVDGNGKVNKSIQELVNTLTKIKEEGNLLYSQKKNFEAIEKYEEGMALGKGFKDIKGHPLYEIFSTKDNKILIYKILIILGANSAQCGLNLKNYSKALTFAVKALKRLKEIEKMVGDAEWDQHFMALKKKVVYRIGESKNNLLPFFHLVRYSDQPVDGVRVGTVITASDGLSGDIFGMSKVLLYEYERGGGVQGVIINKKIKMRNDQMIRLGGPCEMQRKVYLHNVAGARGAVKVLEGVYFGGELREYRNDPSFKIFEYYGYAAWFGGQLDGELRNDDWSWENGVTADDVFGDIDLVIQE